MKLNFGKYSGKNLEDVPKDYLLWLYDNSNNLSDELLVAIAEQLQDTHHNIALDEAYGMHGQDFEDK